MKTLISGIIGAVASSVGWVAIEQGTQNEFGFMPLLVGLITGVAVRMGASAEMGDSIGRGAMAAVLALAASVGAPFMKVTYLQNLNKDADKPQVVEVADDESAGEEGDGQEAPQGKRLDGPLPESESRDGDGPGNDIKFEMPSKKSSSDLSLLWICGSALLAYITGKGGGKAAPVATEQSEDQPESSESSEA